MPTAALKAPSREGTSTGRAPPSKRSDANLDSLSALNLRAVMGSRKGETVSRISGGMSGRGRTGSDGGRPAEVGTFVGRGVGRAVGSRSRRLRSRSSSTEMKLDGSVGRLVGTPGIVAGIGREKSGGNEMGRSCRVGRLVGRISARLSSIPIEARFSASESRRGIPVGNVKGMLSGFDTPVGMMLARSRLIEIRFVRLSWPETEIDSSGMRVTVGNPGRTLGC
jgi:hypothetical protein